MQSPFTPRCVRPKAKKAKVIVDPLHGHLEVPPELVQIIDTLYFQRLRELKQLGCADWVFPGAVHTRFIHSLGVAHLANQVIQRIKQHYPEYGVTERDCILVSMAGLCHDMGHGPFSHGFERVVEIALEEEREKAKEKGDAERLREIPASWHHEQASELLFEEAVNECGLDITPDEVALVKAMIRGVHEDEERPMDKPLFFFQIVANKQTGMDVDKYDYLLRDAMFCGAKIAFDISRLLRPQVRRDGKGNLILAYYRKEEWMIHQLFRSRFDMHHQVYGHSVVVAFTIMVEEVLLLAKDWMRITEAITTPKIYLYLTDSVLHQIECLDINYPPKGFTQASLRKTQSLVRRIKQRDLYTSALQDMTFSLGKNKGIIDKSNKLQIERDLVAELVEQVPELAVFESDFKVVVADRDFTRRSENPLLRVPFYSDRRSDGPVSYLTTKDLENSTQPAKFWERYVRVYIKDRTAEHAGNLHELLMKAFTEVKRTEGPLGPNTPVARNKVISTPEKLSDDFLTSQTMDFMEPGLGATPGEVTGGAGAGGNKRLFATICSSGGRDGGDGDGGDDDEHNEAEVDVFPDDDVPTVPKRMRFG